MNVFYPNNPIPDYVQSSARSRGFPGSRPPGSAGFQPADGRRPAVVHAGKDARDPRNTVVHAGKDARDPRNAVVPT